MRVADMAVYSFEEWLKRRERKNNVYYSDELGPSLHRWLIEEGAEVVCENYTMFLQMVALLMYHLRAKGEGQVVYPHPTEPLLIAPPLDPWLYTMSYDGFRSACYQYHFERNEQRQAVAAPPA